MRTNKNTLYTGITNNLDERLKAHKVGSGSKYMRSYATFELVYTEITQSRSEALKRELQIKKQTKQQKEAMVASFLPTKNSLI